MRKDPNVPGALDSRGMPKGEEVLNGVILDLLNQTREAGIGCPYCEGPCGVGCPLLAQ